MSIGRTLVSEKLVACVNIIDGMTSCYWWEGNIEEANEAILFAKTSEKQVEKVIFKVKEIHSYEVPCIVSMPIEQGNPDYLAWISESVS